MEKRTVYFDNNATTPLHPAVKTAIAEALDVFGNPSSLHAYGRHARTFVEEARGKIAGFIGARPEEIMFVGSGSEGNNTVLSVLTRQCRGCEFNACRGGELITTKIEHPCIMETSRCLAEKGVKVTYLHVDRDGKVDLDQMADSITPMTGRTILKLIAALALICLLLALRLGF